MITDGAPASSILSVLSLIATARGVEPGASSVHEQIGACCPTPIPAGVPHVGAERPQAQ
jgi:hypothetical protein